MKTKMPVLFLLVCVSGFNTVRQPLSAAEAEFPFLLQHELGAAEFASGDAIRITALRGNTRHLESGGTYSLEGTYTLASSANADLAWFSTSRGPSDAKPIHPGEQVTVDKGSGKFRLTKILSEKGWLHISFYVGGRSHGGVYFGEKGNEDTVLRKKSWSDFNVPAAALKDSGPITVTEPANIALLSFLGEPVSAPSDLKPKYSVESVKAAFKQACQKASIEIRTISVDASEFPFLAYGLLSGKHEFREIEAGLRGMAGYVYAGSVVGSSGAGTTHFAINVIPPEQYPSGQFQACNRRLMVRLQMLAELARQAE